MNFLFDIGHPGQVHLFKNVIDILNDRNHKVIVTVKEIPAVKELLDAFCIPYFSLGTKYDSIFFKGLSQLKYDVNLFKIARRERIDIAIGSSISIAHVSRVHKMKSIILDDDDAEAVRLFSLFAHPFADSILSPFPLAHQRTGIKDLIYYGTHELFYLHPEYFKPDPSILEEIGIGIAEPFFIVRFVTGKAYHDKGEEWMTEKQKMKIINTLEKFGRVFITTEREITKEFKKWQLKVSPEKIHHLLYYAKMFVGDSQTMTSEAAILGTPALKCNSFAHKLSIPNMLEDKYGLCFSFQPIEFENMIDKLEILLSDPNLDPNWNKKRFSFLKDSINPTQFLVWFIENYPKSIGILKENPDHQYSFK